MNTPENLENQTDDDSAEEISADRSTIDSLDGIEVPVQFHLGSLSMPLGKLQSIQSGFVFELSTGADSPVTVEVNGTAIGRGELVRIGDRLGVRLVETISHANDSS